MKAGNSSIRLFLSFFCSILVAYSNQTRAQISNRQINPLEANDHGIQLSKLKDIPKYQLPSIDVERLAEEDIEDGALGKPFRFGKALEVDIDFMKSAKTISNRDGLVFFYQISSDNAFSLNLIFDQFKLAKNASLLIYNEEKSMVYGPIYHENNPKNGILWTEY